MIASVTYYLEFCNVCIFDVCLIFYQQVLNE